jgi:amphi-Trp domain-containing protein
MIPRSASYYHAARRLLLPRQHQPQTFLLLQNQNHLRSYATARRHGGDILERDVESLRREKTFAALLRRAADAIDADKGFKVMVRGKRFTVPEDAQLSVEHEVDGDGRHELEFQFTWKSYKPRKVATDSDSAV